MESQNLKLGKLIIGPEIPNNIIDIKLILDHAINIGRAQENLKAILDIEIFDTLSKFNEYWQSEHESENQKLYDCRMQFVNLQDKLDDLYTILRS